MTRESRNKCLQQVERTVCVTPECRKVIRILDEESEFIIREFQSTINYCIKGVAAAAAEGRTTEALVYLSLINTSITSALSRFYSRLRELRSTYRLKWSEIKAIEARLLTKLMPIIAKAAEDLKKVLEPYANKIGADNISLSLAVKPVPPFLVMTLTLDFNIKTEAESESRK